MSAPLIITLLISATLVGIATLIGVFFHAKQYAQTSLGNTTQIFIAQ